jgi:hypothetical protein
MKKIDKWPKTVFNWLELFEKIFTISAICLGGWWFLHRHEGKPRVNLGQTVSHSMIGKTVMLHVSLTITNSGEVPVDLKDESTDVISIVPFEDELPFDPKNTYGNRVKTWYENYVLAQGCMEYGTQTKPECDHRNAMKLESGESDSIQWDFIVPNTVKTVRIYSKCADNPTVDSVWHAVTYYDFSKKKNE